MPLRRTTVSSASQLTPPFLAKACQVRSVPHRAGERSTYMSGPSSRPCATESATTEVVLAGLTTPLSCYVTRTTAVLFSCQTKRGALLRALPYNAVVQPLHPFHVVKQHPLTATAPALVGSQRRHAPALRLYQPVRTPVLAVVR